MADLGAKLKLDWVVAAGWNAVPKLTPPPAGVPVGATEEVVGAKEKPPPPLVPENKLIYNHNNDNTDTTFHIYCFCPLSE